MLKRVVSITLASAVVVGGGAAFAATRAPAAPTVELSADRVFLGDNAVHPDRDPFRIVRTA